MNAFEITILDFIHRNLSSAFWDPIMLFITRFGDAGLFWIALSVLLLIIPKTRKLGLAMGVSLAVEAIICNVVLKPMVARVRPYDVNTAVELILKAPTDFSFPSGHTGASFAVVGALFFQKHRSWIPALVLSVLIAYSRMYLYVHYPTDVLAGVVLGILTGWLSSVILRYFEKKRKEKQSEEQKN